MRRVLDLGLLIILVSAGAVAAPVILGTAFVNGVNNGATSLYSISSTTGAATLIGVIGNGTTGFCTISALAFAPNGTLYGAADNCGTTTHVLITINTSTAAGTLIGPTSGASFSDIAFRSDGTLFGQTGLGALYTINTSTGTATNLGSNGAKFGMALAFSSANVLYRADEQNLNTLNQTNATPTLVTALTYDDAFGTSVSRANGMKFDPATGTLYASVVNGFSPDPRIYSLGTINIVTGVVSRIGATQTGLDAIAISSAGGGNSGTPVGVFRDSSNAIQLTSELTTTLSSAGGSFAGNPAAAQNAVGDTFVVARDNSNALWVNVYDGITKLWGGWLFAGGAVQGTPAIAATGNVAYIVARDQSNAYWTITYTRGTGFSSWVNRGGAFATDPAVTTTATTAYFVGKDGSNSVWTATLTGGTFSAWQFDGAASAGKPSVTVGLDGAAYIAIRDPSTAVWMGRQSGGTFNGWQPGGGSIASDPQVAAATGKVYMVALTGTGVPWYNSFNEGTGNNWTAWASPGGVLTDVAAAAGIGPKLFWTGRDTLNKLWWYENPGVGWKPVGAQGLAAGPLSAAPR